MILRFCQVYSVLFLDHDQSDQPPPPSTLLVSMKVACVESNRKALLAVDEIMLAARNVVAHLYNFWEMTKPILTFNKMGAMM